MKTQNKNKSWQNGKKNRNDYLGEKNYQFRKKLDEDLGRPKTTNKYTSAVKRYGKKYPSTTGREVYKK